MKRVYFDVSGVAGLGDGKARAGLVAQRIREIGVARVLYGSDGTAGDNTPQKAWQAFKELPLSEAEIRTIATNRAPYMR